jgi:hypothetical protein
LGFENRKLDVAPASSEGNAMRNLSIALLALLAVATGGWTVYRQVQSAPTSVTVGEEPEEVTFVCTETGAITRGDWQVSPALNPKTGRRTLMQALYCEKCNKWYPAPPPEMAQQSPRGPACPKDGEVLTMDGPLLDGQGG